MPLFLQTAFLRHQDRRRLCPSSSVQLVQHASTGWTWLPLVVASSAWRLRGPGCCKMSCCCACCQDGICFLECVGWSFFECLLLRMPFLLGVGSLRWDWGFECFQFELGLGEVFVAVAFILSRSGQVFLFCAVGLLVLLHCTLEVWETSLGCLSSSLFRLVPLLLIFGRWWLRRVSLFYCYLSPLYAFDLASLVSMMKCASFSSNQCWHYVDSFEFSLWLADHSQHQLLVWCQSVRSDFSVSFRSFSAVLTAVAGDRWQNFVACWAELLDLLREHCL